VHDPAAGRHPVHVARHDLLPEAETVVMHQRAVEQIGDGRETDMRMRQHVDASARRQHGGAHLVEEDERADEARGTRGQHATHDEVADVAFARREKGLDRGTSASGQPLRCAYIFSVIAVQAPRLDSSSATGVGAASPPPSGAGSSARH